MGCRTRANLYYDNLNQNYDNLNQIHRVEGNVVRKEEPVPAPKEPVRLQRNPRSRAKTIRSGAVRRQKARLTLLGIAGAVVLVALSGFLLTSLEKNNKLSGEIAAKESEVEDLTVYNDTREYEINSSVDLNYVISAATELGMVRSNASQIVTYSVKNSEYLQQVAQVPTN